MVARDVVQTTFLVWVLEVRPVLPMTSLGSMNTATWNEKPSCRVGLPGQLARTPLSIEPGALPSDGTDAMGSDE